MIASACLTLAAIHLLVWWKRRTVWAHLLFSLTSAAIAAFAGCELRMMLEQLSPFRWRNPWIVGLGNQGFARAVPWQGGRQKVLGSGRPAAGGQDWKSDGPEKMHGGSRKLTRATE